MIKNLRLYLLSFICLIAVAVTVVFFLPKAIEWKVKNYLQEKIGFEISYGNSSWSRSGITLKEVILYPKKGTDLDFLLTIDNLKFNYSIDVFKRNIDFNIDCIKPKISLEGTDSKESTYSFFESIAQKNAEDFSDSSYLISLKKSSKLHLLDSTFFINIDEGLLDIKSPNNGTSWPFSLKASIGSKKEFNDEIELTFGSLEHYLNINFGQKKSLKLVEFDLASFSSGIELFMGQPFSVWSIKKGIASGQLEFDNVALKGFTDFKDLSLEHRSSGIGAFIPKVSIEATPKASYEIDTFYQSIIKNTFVNAQLKEKASFYRFKQDLPFWLLKDISGDISINKTLKKGLEIDLDGSFYFSNKEDSLFNLKGNFPINSLDDEGDLLFTLSSKKEDNVSARLIVKDKAEMGRDFDVSLQNFSPREYETVRNLWPEWSFVWEEAQFLGGKISLQLKGNLLPSSSLSKFSVEKLSGSNIWFKSTPLSTEGYIASIKGNMDFIISQNEGYLKPRNGQLDLSDGDFYWESKSLYEGKESLGRLNHLDCKIKLKEGILQNGSFKGNLGGLEAELEYLGLDFDTVAKMKVSGLATKVVDILPGLFADNLKKSLGKEEIDWQGSLDKKDNGLFLQGSLHVSNLDINEEALVVEIGAFLERLPKKDWEDALIKWKKWGISLLEKEKESLLPFQRKGSSHILRVNWLQDKSGSWGLILRQGTFTAKNLSLKRWVEPFISQNIDFNLSGLTSLWGDFNDRSLIVNFDLSNFIFDNNDFKINIEQIRSFEKEVNTLSDPSSFVYFDFQDESVYGFMPLQKASYLQKNKNLFFENISAFLSLSQNHLQLSQIQTLSESISFKGELDADFTSKEALNLVIKAKDVEGSVEQVQKFCAHFGENPAWSWPVKGNLKAINEGVVFEAFVPFDDRKSSINWAAAGALEKAHFDLENNNAAFEDLSLEFSYDSKEQLLNINDVSSLVNPISGNKDEVYHLKASNFTLSLADLPFYNFEVAVDFEDHEILNLKGSILTSENSYQISLDSKSSHIGGFYPKISQCTFDKNFGFKLLKAKPLLILDSFTLDLKRLNQFNLFPSFLKTQIDALDETTQFDGKLKSKINLDEEGFDVDIEGENVKKNNKLIDKCIFKAHSKDHLWLIEDCRFGSFSMQAEMEKKGDEFIINNLGMQDQGIFIESKGFYKNKLLSLDLTKGHLVLQDLKVSKNFHLLSEIWHPQGIVDITGTLNVNFTPADNQPIINWKGLASLHDLQIRGNRFKNQNAIPITFSEIEGLKLQDISLSVKQAGDIHYKTNLNLKGAHYDIEEETLKIEGLGFSLSTSGLNELVNLAEDFFPSFIDEETSFILKDIKRKGGVEGLIDIDISKDDIIVGIALSDGTYTLMGKDHLLSGVYLRYAKDEIIAKATYLFGKQPILAEIRVSKNEPDKGVLRIFEKGDKSSLKISWRYKNQGLEILSAEGAIGGVTLKLAHKKFVENQGQILSGIISLVDANKLKGLLPASIAQIFQDFKIGSGYSYKGDIFIPSEKFSDFTLFGKVEGKDFNLLGLELDNLTFDLSYTPIHAQISKLSIEDAAFKMQIKDIQFNKNAQDKWIFSAPLVRIENLRPIRLAKDKQAMKSIKNLVIYEILVENLQGIVGDAASVKGKASLNFEKVVKNTFGNILLAIPSDILSRIGLNLNLMTPSMGTIYFDIKDKRIYLLKLDGVYSEGKHSRFYLPKESAPSYIDFDGNLNIYIKIKQYNLFMKLTEALRMHITGKFDSPSVDFEKDTSPEEKSFSND
jgi:hypothetical protein